MDKESSPVFKCQGRAHGVKACLSVRYGVIRRRGVHGLSLTSKGDR